MLLDVLADGFEFVLCDLLRLPLYLISLLSPSNLGDLIL
jgi:hypothetical protein